MIEVYKEIIAWIVLIGGFIYLYFSEKNQLQKNQYSILVFMALIGMTLYFGIQSQQLKLFNEEQNQLHRIEKNQILLMEMLEFKKNKLIKDKNK